MITCPKHKIPLKIRRDVKIRELLSTCPFCKVEKRAASCDAANQPTAIPFGDSVRTAIPLNRL